MKFKFNNSKVTIDEGENATNGFHSHAGNASQGEDLFTIIRSKFFFILAFECLVLFLSLISFH